MDGCSRKELTEDIIKEGLGCLGRHPILINHAFLELNLSGHKDLVDIGPLCKYTNIMYLDISDNQVSDVSVLQKMPALTQLRASDNRIESCLDFAPPLCTSENAWSSGHRAVGSLLSSVDLRGNAIAQINDLSRHKLIEVLLLGRNFISKIEGLSNLSNLKVLDLSYNNLCAIEGLRGLMIQELNLRGNRIEDLSALGAEELPRLTVLDLAENRIKTLKPLRACDHLSFLDVRDNKLEAIRQVEFLKDLKSLEVLYFIGNPAARKPHYRKRIIFRLPHIDRIDFTKVSSEEKVRGYNVYPEISNEGDQRERKEVHNRYLPGEEFMDFNVPLYDEELQLTWEELEAGESFALRDEKIFIEKAIVRENAENVVFDAVNTASTNAVGN